MYRKLRTQWVMWNKWLQFLDRRIAIETPGLVEEVRRRRVLVRGFSEMMAERKAAQLARRAYCPLPVRVLECELNCELKPLGRLLLQRTPGPKMPTAPPQRPNSSKVEVHIGSILAPDGLRRPRGRLDHRAFKSYVFFRSKCHQRPYRLDEMASRCPICDIYHSS